MRTSNLLIATLLIVMLAAPTLADYPMFGLDPYRTGNASGDAPLSNMRLWETKLGEKSYIGGGASVVGDRVYVANWPTMPAGYIYRTWILLSGQIRWKRYLEHFDWERWWCLDTSNRWRQGICRIPQREYVLHECRQRNRDLEHNH